MSNSKNSEVRAEALPAQITSFDKPTLRALRPVIDKHLAALAAETGLVIEIGRGSFMEGQCDYPLSIKIKGALTKAVRSWNVNAAYLGLPADGIGKMLRFADGEAEVTGLERRKVLLAYPDGRKAGAYISVDQAVKMFRLQHGFINTSHAGPTAGIAGLIARQEASVAK